MKKTTKRQMTLDEAVNIFFSGVSTHNGINMMDWFTAKEIIDENRGKLKSMVRYGMK
jgi:hypothetical protein